MAHWLHHIFFDPLSAWEQLKIELIGGVMLIALIIAGWLLGTIVLMIRKKI